MMLPTLLLLAALAVQTTQPAAPAAGTPAAQIAGQKLAVDISTDDLLEALHQRGLDLTGFTGEVTQNEYIGGFGSEEILKGKLVYDATSGSIRVDFQTRDVKDGRGPRSYQLTHLLNKGWLTTRNVEGKSQERRQVSRPNEKINLLKLGEGSFPIPIGQDPVEVNKQFDVSRPASDDPRPVVRLVPKEGTKLAKKFNKIDIWVDPVTHFPTKIETTTGASNDMKTTELDNLKVNPPIGPGAFQLPPVDPAWKQTESPLED